MSIPPARTWPMAAHATRRSPDRGVGQGSCRSRRRRPRPGRTWSVMATSHLPSTSTASPVCSPPTIGSVGVRWKRTAAWVALVNTTASTSRLEAGDHRSVVAVHELLVGGGPDLRLLAEPGPRSPPGARRRRPRRTPPEPAPRRPRDRRAARSRLGARPPRPPADRRRRWCPLERADGRRHPWRRAHPGSSGGPSR